MYHHHQEFKILKCVNVRYWTALLQCIRCTQSRLHIFCRCDKYCSVFSRCWVATSKQTTKQHSLLGNRFLISKYTRPLFGWRPRGQVRSHGDDSGNNGTAVFSTWSVPRRGLEHSPSSRRRGCYEVHKDYDRKDSVKTKNMWSTLLWGWC
jgi:hypothetical protein